MKPKIIPMFGADISDEYNQRLRAKRRKAFIAKCCIVAAVLLLITAVAGMISTVASPAFSAVVATTLIAGFWGWRYLATHH